MDAKAQLIAAIDSPQGIHEDYWMAIMGLLEEMDPIWEDMYCRQGHYFIPNKYKGRLKEIIMRPDVEIVDHSKQDKDMVVFDDDTLPEENVREKAIHDAKMHYHMAERAWDVGDYNDAMNEIELALKLQPNNNEYITFGINIAALIDKTSVNRSKEVEIKEIDVSKLRCDCCKGIYHPATGHAFFVKGELKGVACGICAGRWWAKRLRTFGWHPVKLSKKQRRSRRKREARERKNNLRLASEIVANIRKPDMLAQTETMINEGGCVSYPKRGREYVYPYWPEDI